MRRHGRAVDSSLPLKGKERRGRGTSRVAGGRWSEIGLRGVAVAMAVVPANTPVMTGQTEICITLGEARTRLLLRNPAGKASPSVSVKPPNFLGLGSDQEFPVVIELSVSSVRDSTC